MWMLNLSAKQCAPITEVEPKVGKTPIICLNAIGHNV